MIRARNGIKPLTCTLMLCCASVVSAKTLVFPHLIEPSGGIGDNAVNSFDTTIFVTYNADIPDPTATADDQAGVSFYLFDDSTGLPFLSDGGATICAPCTFDLGHEGFVPTDPGMPGIEGISPRKRKVNIENLLRVNDGGGNFSSSGVVLGFSIITIDGDDNNVTVTQEIQNYRSGPGDLSVFVFEPVSINVLPSPSPPSGPPPVHLAFDNVVDHPGDPNISPSAQSTVFHAVYAGGLAGLPDGGGATIGVQLFDQNGVPLLTTDPAGPTWVPLFDLAQTRASATFSVEDILALAGLPALPGPFQGRVEFYLEGDTDRLALTGFTQQSLGDLGVQDFHQLSPRIVPEPTSLVLVGLGGLLIARRRRP